MMGEEGVKEIDVEEGEISDSTSLEEITKEDFSKKNAGEEQEEEVVQNNPKQPQPETTRVWTMQDLYNHPMYHGYARGLYNFAWAQAVQNKPSPNKEVEEGESKVINVDSGDDENEIVDVKMEEEEVMELEEGEIDLDLDSEQPVNKEEEEDKEITSIISSNNNDDDVLVNNDDNLSVSKMCIDLEELEKSLREDLERVNYIETEKSFEEVCSQLQKTLESLKEVGLEVQTKDALVELAWKAMLTVNCVFIIMNQNHKEQNKPFFSRLLILITCQDPPLFRPEQMKEIGVMMSSLSSIEVSCNKVSSQEKEKSLTCSQEKEKFLTCSQEKEKSLTDGVVENAYDALATNNGQNLSSLKKFVYDSLIGGSSLKKGEQNMLSQTLKPELSNVRVRGAVAPLLDLHKDHDTDSLPSPTSKSPTPWPVHKAMTVGDGMVKSELATARMPRGIKSSVIHPYENAAVNAVSTYQQKFARTSAFSSDRLPSPTPSDEGDNGDADTCVEVSSSSSGAKIQDVNPPLLSKPIVSYVTVTDGSNGQGPVCTSSAMPVSSGFQSNLKVSAKSRDPRLRFACSDSGNMDLNRRPLPAVNNVTNVESLGGTISSRKNRVPEEPFDSGPALKKPRNGSTATDNIVDVKHLDGGWLEDIGTVGPKYNNKNQLQNMWSDPRKMETGVTPSTIISAKPAVATCATEPKPVTSISASSPLPGLLKDIAVNPTMLLNLLKMGQQNNLLAEAQPYSGNPVISTANTRSSTSILGAVPSTNVSPSKCSVLGQKPEVTLQIPSQVDSVDNQGKYRMKPRDPRRVLQSNKFQASENLGLKQSKTNAAPTVNSQGSKDILNFQKLEDQEDAQSLSSTAAPPDITRQFTKNLKNIADIISSQTATTSLVASETPTSVQVETNSDKVDEKVTVSDVKEQESGTGSKSEGIAGSSRPHVWGDVEHLFDGYDDHQIAAIQKERARRIEEQKKMFAARKLCLVLDLDHTLLNSAKFVEVDPTHDEILRKKEEQDREKPYRHLFRFPHMGMWTKLRPGIWKFLEKASKLYELHLYTMGNKLYASEMAKVLDPKGVLFAGRVISKGDDGDLFDGEERVPKSKDLEGVLGMESAVVIIDDSVRVWPHNKLNLIIVERYIYFPCSRRQFGLPGPSLLEIDHDERPEDGTLASSLAVIERIHQNFFSNQSLDEVDVRNILASEQHRILAGCRIVFSRVFPVGEANPHLHPLWQTAEQFGAVCTNQLDDQVTHVVANSLGTDKVNWALSTGKHVVHPGWVEASALLYRRANEQDFAIKP